MTGAVGEDAAEALRTETRRVADRLRTFPLARLDRPGGEGAPSRADLVRVAAQRLADLAAEAAGDRHRRVPVVAVHALADQIAVLAADVLATGSATTCRAAASVLEDLRRAL